MPWTHQLSLGFRLEYLRRARQPTPVFLPGESHGHTHLVGYSSWGSQSRTWLKWLSMHACTRIFVSELLMPQKPYSQHYQCIFLSGYWHVLGGWICQFRGRWGQTTQNKEALLHFGFRVRTVMWKVRVLNPCFAEWERSVFQILKSFHLYVKSEPWRSEIESDYFEPWCWEERLWPKESSHSAGNGKSLQFGSRGVGGRGRGEGELRREGARKGVISGVFLFLPLSSCLLVKGSMSGKEGQIVNTSQRSWGESVKRVWTPTPRSELERAPWVVPPGREEKGGGELLQGA